MRLSVERRVELSSAVDDKGTTLYSQLMQLKKQGVTDPLLEPIEIPRSAQWILDIFWKLHNQRHYDGMSGSPFPIPYEKIYAYQKLHAFRFSAFDIMALEEMDGAYFEAVYKVKQGKEKICQTST